MRDACLKMLAAVRIFRVNSVNVINS
jgi:hypothetical protein